MLSFMFAAIKAVLPSGEVTRVYVLAFAVCGTVSVGFFCFCMLMAISEASVHVRCILNVNMWLMIILFLTEVFVFIL